MTGRVVVDASAFVAVLTDNGADGVWASEQIAGRYLSAPELMPFETSNILRRLAARSAITSDLATLSHSSLQECHIDLWPYSLLAERCWQLRNNLTVYDASYVTLAEILKVPLVTLDHRIASAPGIRCTVLTPRV
ncbi:MAG: type II toxin-antitoxin system VapC family toxin [Cellulomonadaceae bacterium]|jgi:predicted nucleic acid-binding protein|nr:type II toxin-antitoxin system VapC family toxin [Cellulomonadaceae bacterium]